MLKDTFYLITAQTHQENCITAAFQFDSAHSIFAGHFPGQPVVPGACLLQMVKEVMQIITGSDLQLVNAHHLKFISLIDPSKNETLDMVLTHKLSENNEWIVSATVSYDA